MDRQRDNLEILYNRCVSQTAFPTVKRPAHLISQSQFLSLSYMLLIWQYQYQPLCLSAVAVPRIIIFLLII